MVGTASYLAPEQVTGEHVGPPADVYALGLVLLETLTGRREYAGPAVEAAMARLTRAPEIPSTLPLGWQPLLEAMTRRDPLARPTAGEVAGSLRALLAGDTTTVLPARTEAIAETPRTSALPVAPAVVAPRNRTPMVVAALVGVFVLGAAGTVLATRGQSAPQQIPAISPDLPAEVRAPLQQLVTRVQQ